MTQRRASDRAGLGLGRAMALTLGVAFVAALPEAGLAQVDREAARTRAAEAFGAEVLRVREGTVDGRAAWLVTLMHPGGNDNAAFKVDTIAIDAESGEPMRGWYPEGPGAGNFTSARTQTLERRPDVLRGRAWR